VAKRKARPSGREEVATAILESAGKLFAERGPSGVALRKIADDAAVYANAAENAASRLREVDHLDDALSMLMTFGDGTTARLIAWAVLDGKDPTELLARSPALSVLADLLRRDASGAGVRVSADDARVFVAIAMVIALGWRLFGPVALAQAGADSHEPEHYADQVQAYVRRFARSAISQDGSKPAPKRPAPKPSAVKATPTRRRRDG
jgi:hypothetical protein